MQVQESKSASRHRAITAILASTAAARLIVKFLDLSLSESRDSFVFRF